MNTPNPLIQIPLFAEVAAGDLETLGTSLRRRQYDRGTVIFHQGDPGAALFIIESGEVKICSPSPDGKETIFALLGPGDFFGEMALLDAEPRSADAVAQEPCRLLLLHRTDFLHFLKERPQVAVALLAVLSRRLRRTNQALQDLMFLDVPGRLARVLLQLAERQGREDATGIVLTSRLTQGELADMVGASRETINRWLRVYERQGLIRHDQGRLTLLRPEELRERSEAI